MSTPHRPDPRFLTHFVDACFCHRTHAAGYGAWAKKAAFEKGLIFGGPLPRGISNAGEAELGGIALIFSVTPLPNAQAEIRYPK